MIGLPRVYFLIFIFFIADEKLMQDGTISLHRADMLKVLTDALQPYIDSGSVKVYFNKKLEYYMYEKFEHDVRIVSKEKKTRGEKVHLHFGDGAVTEVDLLVGADGVRSATRASMYRLAATREAVAGDTEKSQALLKHIEPTWTGTLAYRALIETEKLKRVNDVEKGRDNANEVHRSALRSIIVSRE